MVKLVLQLAISETAIADIPEASEQDVEDAVWQLAAHLMTDCARQDVWARATANSHPRFRTDRDNTRMICAV